MIEVKGAAPEVATPSAPEQAEGWPTTAQEMYLKLPAPATSQEMYLNAILRAVESLGLLIALKQLGDEAVAQAEAEPVAVELKEPAEQTKATKHAKKK